MKPNPHIEKVEEWRKNKDAVTLEELKANQKSADGVHTAACAAHAKSVKALYRAKSAYAREVADILIAPHPEAAISRAVTKAEAAWEKTYKDEALAETAALIADYSCMAVDFSDPEETDDDRDDWAACIPICITRYHELTKEDADVYTLMY